MDVTLVMSEQGKAHWDAARAVLQEAIAEAGLSVEVVETIVGSEDEARTARCIGSPTIRVNGFDVEYMEREPDERSLGQRYFNTTGGWKPVPERGMVVRALQRAHQLESGR